jgi:hypothetical protein
MRQPRIFSGYIGVFQDESNGRIDNFRLARHSTAIGGLWSIPQRCAGVLPISAVDRGFHLMDACAALACSFHR